MHDIVKAHSLALPVNLIGAHQTAAAAADNDKISTPVYCSRQFGNLKFLRGRTHKT
jgi:hypothetical protein